MLTPDDIDRITRDEFVARNPRLAAELAAMTGDEFCGITAADDRTSRLNEELDKAAALHGLEYAWDYQLMLAESLGHDVSHICTEERRKVAEILGVDNLQ